MTPETPIHQARFAGIDFESAGAARGRTDVPVQIGLASWSIHEGHAQAYVSYLRSSSPITWSARKVHGIQDEDLIGAPSLLELWPVIKKRLGSAVVVAHGKGTEKRFLRAFPGHGFGPWVDTLLLARAAWPELPDHSLSALCISRNLEPRIRELAPKGSWHDALFDTIASLALLEDIITSFELADRPLAQLVFPDTREWHQQRSR
ncbi:exonuclease domain-containing protein [Haloferula chungangensis]|uniref:Exonuclease domain-containing protein n=1 Tax=Haloferula chungangensis TaxID=1048331 RepID=A0ABW2L3Y4_9BACT